MDSLGNILSPLDIVDVDNRLLRPGIIDPNLMTEDGFPLLVDGHRSGWGRTVAVTSRGGLRDPTSQDSPLPVGPLPFVELLASLLPMEVVGDSLRAQPPILAIERMARSAIDPVFGGVESSVATTGTGVTDLEGPGTGDAALPKVYTEEIEETGPVNRMLDGWDLGSGAGARVSHYSEIQKAALRTTAAKLVLPIFAPSAQGPFPFFFVGLVRLDSGARFFHLP